MASRSESDFLRQSGSAVVSGLIAAVILVVVAVVVGTYVSRTSTQGRRVAAATTCSGVASNLVYAITSLDDSIKIRNLLVSPATNRGLPDATDPYCATSGANGCDTVNHVTDFTATLDPTMSFVPIQLYSAQNIRGAMSWALATYNNQQPAICTGNGLVYNTIAGGVPDPAAVASLNSLLPSTGQFTPDDRVEKVQFSITPYGGGPGCGAGPLSINPKSGIGLRVTFRVTYRLVYPDTQECMDTAVLMYAGDVTNNVIPAIKTLDSTGTIDLSGAPDATGAPAGTKCTCQKGGGNCGPGDIYSMQMGLSASEPGSNFVARMITNGAPTPAAPGLQYFSAFGTTLTLSSLLFNLPTTATAAVSFNSAAGEATYQFAVRSIDTSANFSSNEPLSLPVITRTPTCDTAAVACGVTVYDTCGVACGTGTSGCGPGPGAGPGPSGPCDPGQLAAGWVDDSSGNCCGPPPDYGVVGGICYPSCGTIASAIHGLPGVKTPCGDPTPGDHNQTPAGLSCAAFSDPVCGGKILTAFPETSLEMAQGTSGQCCRVNPVAACNPAGYLCYTGYLSVACGNDQPVAGSCSCCNNGGNAIPNPTFSEVCALGGTIDHYDWICP